MKRRVDYQTVVLKREDIFARYATALEGENIAELSQITDLAIQDEQLEREIRAFNRHHRDASDALRTGISSVKAH